MALITPIYMTMLKPRVAIIDYQMGNLRSVERAVAHAGGEPVVTNDRQLIEKSDRIILPGVGAFKDAIAELHRRDLSRLIIDLVAADRPLLGICLGLQMLLESSDERGTHEGLSIIPGHVVRFDLSPEFKVPHMGWNRVEQQAKNIEAHQIESRRNLPAMWNDLPEKPHFYFVHSHFVVPGNSADEWLACRYEKSFCAAIRRSNLIATQFHPEKSQRDGLQLLKNFLNVEAIART